MSPKICSISLIFPIFHFERLGKDANRWGKPFAALLGALEAELDLKKAASAVKEKAVSMIKQKELLPLTGYVHGGCSPIGMKKPFKTFVHQTAKEYDRIFVSAGKVGYQIELSPTDLEKMVRIGYADIIVDNN